MFCFLKNNNPLFFHRSSWDGGNSSSAVRRGGSGPGRGHPCGAGRVREAYPPLPRVGSLGQARLARALPGPTLNEGQRHTRDGTGRDAKRPRPRRRPPHLLLLPLQLLHPDVAGLGAGRALRRQPGLRLEQTGGEFVSGRTRAPAERAANRALLRADLAPSFGTTRGAAHRGCAELRGSSRPAAVTAMTTPASPAPPECRRPCPRASRVPCHVPLPPSCSSGRGLSPPQSADGGAKAQRRQ